jgi:hypothetical protein
MSSVKRRVTRQVAGWEWVHNADKWELASGGAYLWRDGPSGYYLVVIGRRSKFMATTLRHAMANAALFFAENPTAASMAVDMERARSAWVDLAKAHGYTEEGY